MINTHKSWLSLADAFAHAVETEEAETHVWGHLLWHVPNLQSTKHAEYLQ